MAGAREFGVCQCCFGHHNRLVAMLSYLQPGVTKNYAEMLMETFAVNVVSRSSMAAGSKPLICYECIARLRDAHAFHAQVHRAQARLLEQGLCNYPVIVKAESREGDEAAPLGRASCDVPSQVAGDMGEPHRAEDSPLQAGPSLTAQSLFTCDTCLKSFSEKCQLVSHLGTHESGKHLRTDSTFPYVCNNCDESFWDNTDLQAHLRIHTGEKPYVCKYCNAAFSENSHLESHLSIHTGEKPYACEHCDMTFSHGNLLKYHRRGHIGDKPYVCKYCNAAYAQSVNLNYHLAEHTERKPYICGFCKSTFSTNSRLKRHLWYKHRADGNPFVCNHCNVPFMKYKFLKLHQLIHANMQSHL